MQRGTRMLDGQRRWRRGSAAASPAAFRGLMRSPGRSQLHRHANKGSNGRPSTGNRRFVRVKRCAPTPQAGRRDEAQTASPARARRRREASVIGRMSIGGLGACHRRAPFRRDDDETSSCGGHPRRQWPRAATSVAVSKLASQASGNPRDHECARPPRRDAQRLSRRAWGDVLAVRVRLKVSFTLLVDARRLDCEVEADICKHLATGGAGGSEDEHWSQAGSMRNKPPASVWVTRYRSPSGPCRTSRI